MLNIKVFFIFLGSSLWAMEVSVPLQNESPEELIHFEHNRTSLRTYLIHALAQTYTTPFLKENALKVSGIPSVEFDKSFEHLERLPIEIKDDVFVMIALYIIFSKLSAHDKSQVLRNCLLTTEKETSVSLKHLKFISLMCNQVLSYQDIKGPTTRIKSKVFFEHVDSVELRGAFRRVTNEIGYSNEDITLLHIAAYLNNKELTQFLLSFKRTTMTSDAQGSSPLHYAALAGSWEVMKVLIAQETRVTNINNKGATVLEVALEHDSFFKNSNLEFNFFTEHIKEFSVAQKIAVKILSSSSLNLAQITVFITFLKTCRWYDKFLPIIKFYLAIAAHDSYFYTLFDPTFKNFLVSDDENAQKLGNITALHIAAQFGNKEAIQWLIRHGEDIEARTVGGRSVLHRAIEFNQEEIAHLLLESGATPNVLDEDGYSPLLSAIAYENNKLSQLLLEKGALTQGLSENEENPLCHAVISGNEFLVKLFLASGAQVNVQSREGYSPLSYALRAGNKTIIQLLIEYGADLAECKQLVEQMLQQTIVKNDVSLLQFLLSEMKGIAIMKESSFPFFGMAVSKGSIPIVKLLLEKGASADGFSGKSDYPIGEAIVRDNEDMVRLLLQYNASVNSVNKLSSDTPLHYAVYLKNKNIIRLLLEAGATANICNNRGYTALELAQNDEDLLKIFNEKSSEVVQYKRQKGSLRLAIPKVHERLAYLLIEKAQGNVEERVTGLGEKIYCLTLETDKLIKAVEMLSKQTQEDHQSLFNLLIFYLPVSARLKLLMKDTDSLTSFFGSLFFQFINSEDCYGDTLLICSIVDISLVQRIIMLGADVNYKNSKGSTPLHEAVGTGKKKIVKYLVKCGASLEEQDACGLTPLHRALYDAKRSIFKFLMSQPISLELREEMTKAYKVFASFLSK